MCHVCDNSCHVVIQVYCGCMVFDVSSGHSFSGLYDFTRVAIRHFFNVFGVLRERRMPTRLRLGENTFQSPWLHSLLTEKGMRSVTSEMCWRW